MKMLYDVLNTAGCVGMERVEIVLDNGTVLVPTWEEAEIHYNTEERLSTASCTGVTFDRDNITVASFRDDIASIRVRFDDEARLDAKHIIIGIAFVDDQDVVVYNVSLDEVMA